MKATLSGLEEIIRLSPEHIDARLTLGKMLARLGRVDAAEHVL